MSALPLYETQCLCFHISKTERVKKSKFHVRRLYYVVYNDAKILSPGVKMGAASRPDVGQNAKNTEKVSPDKGLT